MTYRTQKSITHRNLRKFGEKIAFQVFIQFKPNVTTSDLMIREPLSCLEQTVRVRTFIVRFLPKLGIDPSLIALDTCYNSYLRRIMSLPFSLGGGGVARK